MAWPGTHRITASAPSLPNPAEPSVRAVQRQNYLTSAPALLALACTVFVQAVSGILSHGWFTTMTPSSPFRNVATR